MSQHLATLLCFLLSVVTLGQTQTLYYCNFDTSTSTDNCFTAASTSVVASQGTATSAPNGPLSDVTAILKPTLNGHVCKLPYKFGANDIYFCNGGTCETINNGGTSPCASGRFAVFPLNNNNLRSVQLKIPAGSITSTGQQCLTYYYHMSTQYTKNLTVRKLESSGANDTLDSVTSVPMNAWTQRKVQFNAIATDYSIFFDIQKTSVLGAPFVSLDEISIKQGSCDDQPPSTTATPSPSTTTIPSTTSTTTSSPSTSTITSTLAPTTTPVPSTTTITSTLAPTTTPLPSTTTITSTLAPSTTTPVASTSTITSTTIPPVSSTITSSVSTTTTTTTTSATQESTTPVPIISSTTTTITSPSSTPMTSTSSTTTESATTSTSSSGTTTTTSASAATMTTTTSAFISTTSSSMVPIISSTTTTARVMSTSTTGTTTTTSGTPKTNGLGQIVVTEYSEDLPSDKAGVVAMAVIIPLAWVVFLAAVIWIKKSGSILSGIRQPFSNGGQGAESATTIEMSAVSET